MNRERAREIANEKLRMFSAVERDGILDAIEALAQPPEEEPCTCRLLPYPHSIGHDEPEFDNITEPAPTPEPRDMEACGPLNTLVCGVVAGHDHEPVMLCFDWSSDQRGVGQMLDFLKEKGQRNIRLWVNMADGWTAQTASGLFTGATPQHALSRCIAQLHKDGSL